MEQQIDTPSFKPLYQQVKQLLITRLTDRVWEPGELLPSESQLAAEFGVSQGTVRKALDEMTSENLLRRLQGRGTFVTEHTDSRSVFHFLNLVDDSNQKQIPLSEPISITKCMATNEESERLGLQANATVIRFKRVRYLSHKPVIVETITVPYSLTPGLEKQFDKMPNTLYRHYEKAYGFSVTRATEWLSAVSADSHQAELLNVAEGAPLLSVCRIAYTYNDLPVELRVSVCLTESHRYLSELT